MKKEWVAMLLAGGEGKRLGVLTRRIAKPAVPFGGKYRIIDFALSNCTNSGIDTVGILTQYQPLVLHSYIGIGSNWGLDRKNGGVTVLPPFVRQSGGRWYNGTADAIYQNIYFIDRYNPEYVLILSGDHIYKMDYNLMLDFHKEKKAELTIAVIEVPLKEASRFGTIIIDDKRQITGFEEKAKQPKSNLASMGIYVFNWKLLKKYLLKDADNLSSSHDFGKDVIPLILKEKKRMFAYNFKGYWKDVGTVESLWEANMDLLTDKANLNLYDADWKIYSVNPNLPAQYIAPTAKVKSSLINDGCIVYGKVKDSVLFYGVSVGENAVIEDSIILPNAQIGNNAVIKKAIVGSGMIVTEGSRIGTGDEGEKPKGIILVGEAG